MRYRSRIFAWPSPTKGCRSRRSCPSQRRSDGWVRGGREGTVPRRGGEARQRRGMCALVQCIEQLVSLLLSSAVESTVAVGAQGDGARDKQPVARCLLARKGVQPKSASSRQKHSQGTQQTLWRRRERASRPINRAALGSDLTRLGHRGGARLLLKGFQRLDWHPLLALKNARVLDCSPSPPLRESSLRCVLSHTLQRLLHCRVRLRLTVTSQEGHSLSTHARLSRQQCSLPL